MLPFVHTENINAHYWLIAYMHMFEHAHIYLFFMNNMFII